MRIRYTAEAIRGLERLRTFVESKNPHAARRIAAELLDGIESLTGFPDIGLPVRRGACCDDSVPTRYHCFIGRHCGHIYVIDSIDPAATTQVVYIKSELTRQGIVKNDELDAFFVAVGDTVIAFKGLVAGESINLVISEDNILSDISSGTEWNVRGKYLGGSIESARKLTGD